MKAENLQQSSLLGIIFPSGNMPLRSRPDAAGYNFSHVSIQIKLTRFHPARCYTQLSIRQAKSSSP
jgi:hypothetical protein